MKRVISAVIALLSLPAAVFAMGSGPKGTPDLYEAPFPCAPRPEFGPRFSADHPMYCVGSTWDGRPLHFARDQAPGQAGTLTPYTTNPPLAEFGSSASRVTCGLPNWQKVPVPSGSELWRQDFNFYKLPYDVRLQIGCNRRGESK